MQTPAPGSLALQEPRLTSEQGREPGTVQPALDKDYRSELSAWVESAAPTGRAVHQEVERRINAYLQDPAGQRKSINLLSLDLLTVPPLPADLIALDESNNNLTALPEHLPQGLQQLNVGFNRLTILQKHLPQNLKCLSAVGNCFDSKTLVAFMRSNASITEVAVDWNNINAGARQEIDAELMNNKKHPARLLKAAVTLDLLTRFGLTPSDQTGTLIKRDSTPNPVAGQLPEQPIPAELHDVLAANCSKDVLAVLAGIVDGRAR